MSDILKRQLLKDINKIFNQYKISHFLMGGTLLGAIRDKNFIVGDNDIDLGVFKDFWNLDTFPSILKDLKNESIIVNNLAANCVLNVTRDSIPLDVCFHRKTNEHYIIQGNGWKIKIPEEFLNSLDCINFLGIDINIPHNVEEYLNGFYNNSWRTKLEKKETKFGWKINPGKLEHIIKFTNFYYIYSNNE